MIEGQSFFIFDYTFLRQKIPHLCTSRENIIVCWKSGILFNKTKISQSSSWVRKGLIILNLLKVLNIFAQLFYLAMSKEFVQNFSHFVLCCTSQEKLKNLIKHVDPRLYIFLNMYWYLLKNKFCTHRQGGQMHKMYEKYKSFFSFNFWKFWLFYKQKVVYGKH